MRLYLDAAPIIYWVEKVAAFYPQVDARIKQVGVTLVSSHLALMECLVLPLRQGQSGLQQDYDQFFATQIADIVAFTESVHFPFKQEREKLKALLEPLADDTMSERRPQ